MSALKAGVRSHIIMQFPPLVEELDELPAAVAAGSFR
jgi:hypothetical protein